MIYHDFLHHVKTDLRPSRKEIRKAVKRHCSSKSVVDKARACTEKEVIRMRTKVRMWIMIVYLLVMIMLLMLAGATLYKTDVKQKNMYIKIDDCNQIIEEIYTKEGVWIDD